MWKKLSLLAAMLMAVQTFLAPASPSVDAAAASKMTKYRVYQNDKALKEFATEAQAVYYADHYSYSHVEQISDRKWIWDNFPRYKVYQSGRSNAKMEFATYNQALAYAKTLKNASVRDLQNVGWLYDSYPNFRLYQGDNTLPNWTFRTLEEAKKEAKKWGNVHVIDLASGKWVWDNLTEAQVNAQSSAAAVYEIVQDGVPIDGVKTYSFLRNAIHASEAYPNSEIVNVATGKTVHSNVPTYEVRQSGKPVKAFIGLKGAVNLAKTLANAEVIHQGAVLWSSMPYLEVYQGDKKIKAYHALSSALYYAKHYANSSVRTLEGRVLWSNAKTLQFLGWNGSSATSTIMSHVSNTQGLTFDSPTWFELTAADGTLSDMSDTSVVKTLEERGIQVTPLVHNGFNRKMTSEFLRNANAQSKFIGALVGRLSALGVYGVNLDFEEVAGADRALYTSFVKKLTDAAHAKGLKVSIDLPRGDASWNHLTAYDHAALAGIVDMIMIMAYDEHWKGSTEPGSVAGLKWTEDGVKQFLDYGVPRNKLMLGIPFYVREWRIDSAGKLVDNRAILMKDLPKLIADTKAAAVYDPESGQNKYAYKKDGYTHVFWAETHNTVLARMAIAKKYDLAGVAAWRLGYEDAELWTKMLQAR
ncbi:glycosyl hydrolase family 18 protein [Paenibacillus sp. LHD-117]|uniref:glycosyl hydrolase family 18 protein n=1 Tax=Paenibacillus sp. LHD-117 TaxID=3071412 RepID=UPI0027DFDD79|nr:glycosyl hydrolase family 18 protein [Paenibacillus sp. LHD-117]MDQ6418135.1 glycosyl hydrolase family 18 protein [Paenibacillus sp. LHD-117]